MKQKRGKSLLPPLAERLRPRSFEEFVGQAHLTDEGEIIREVIISGELFSLILWGPPGCGKTTLAHLFASTNRAHFTRLNAVSSGVKEIRKIIEEASFRLQNGVRTILFIDEIHRFNKAQQDALLNAVEAGTIILFGATTENPSFEVIPPLLSRCRVLQLQPLTLVDLDRILQRALEEDILLSQMEIQWEEEARSFLLNSAGGDARKLLNTLELAVNYLSRKKTNSLLITTEIIKDCLQKTSLIYDKKGDYHYDTISAFIKSVRGSDPDAAVYWMTLMLEGGEDPLFIARRLIILASEDIGNADPHGLTLAVSGYQAVHFIGLPEAAIILAQVTTYLAAAPKSNASYLALQNARKEVKKHPLSPVPLHLRNAPTNLMKELKYGSDYKYPHDFPEHFVHQNYLPENVKNLPFYKPSKIGYEQFILQRLKSLWKERYPQD